MKKIELDLKIEGSLQDLREKIAALPRVRDGKIYKVNRQDKPQKRAGRPKKVKFSAVRVRPDVVPLERKVLTLELPGGAKVHGLSLTELRELISIEGGAR